MSPMQTQRCHRCRQAPSIGARVSAARCSTRCPAARSSSAWRSSSRCRCQARSRSAATLPTFSRVVDTVAGLALAAGRRYFVFRLIVLAKRRLLWRVRRKLILSYVFIGFVPALLLVAFSLLCGFLLFYNFSSYLVQSRLRALAEQARYFGAEHRARNPARRRPRRRRHHRAPAGERRQLDVIAMFRSIGLRSPRCIRGTRGGLATSTDVKAIVDHRGPPVTAGPWAHVDPPREMPAWIACAGFSGVLAYSHRRSAGGDGRGHSSPRARRRVSRFAARPATPSSSICSSTTRSGSSCATRPASS